MDPFDRPGRVLGSDALLQAHMQDRDASIGYSAQHLSAELLKYKEAYATVKEQLTLQREKHRLYKVESQLNIQSLQQRLTQLEIMERQLREENIKLSSQAQNYLPKQSDERVDKLEAQISAYRLDGERQKHARNQLEEELRKYIHASKIQVTESKRREEILETSVRQYQEQCGKLQLQMQEKDKEIRSAQGLLMRQQQELDDRTRMITEANEAIKRLEREKRDSLDSMALLQTRIDQLRVGLQSALGGGSASLLQNLSMGLSHELTSLLEPIQADGLRNNEIIAYQQQKIDELQANVESYQRKVEELQNKTPPLSPLPPPPFIDPELLATIEKLVHFIKIIEETLSDIIQGERFREKDRKKTEISPRKIDFLRLTQLSSDIDKELEDIKTSICINFKKIEHMANQTNALTQKVSELETSLPLESQKVREVSEQARSFEDEKEKLATKLDEATHTQQVRSVMIGDLCTQLYEANVKLGFTIKPPPPSSAMAVLSSMIDPEILPWSTVYKALSEQVYLTGKSALNQPDKSYKYKYTGPAQSPPKRQPPSRPSHISDDDETSVYSEETLLAHTKDHTLDRFRSPLKQTTKKIIAANDALSRSIRSSFQPIRTPPTRDSKSRPTFGSPSVTPITPKSQRRPVVFPYGSDDDDSN